MAADAASPAPALPPPGDFAEIPANLPRSAEYFKSIPTPREVSTDWKVIGSNATLAMVLTFLVGTFAGVVAKLTEAKEDRLATPLVKAIGRLRQAAAWRGFQGPPFSWLPGSRFTGAVLMMFVFGAIYAFLDNGAGLFGPECLVILVTLSLTSGFFTLYEPWVRARLARGMRIPAKVALYPGQALIAILSVAASRALSFQPGLMLGEPGGLQMDDEPAPKQQVRLDALSLAFVALLGATAWFIVFWLPLLATQFTAFFAAARGLTSGLQDWCLAAFAMASQRVFFGLLPMPRSTGAAFMRHHLLFWAIPMAIAAFAFLHTALNREGTVTDLTPQLAITFAVALLLAAAAQLYLMFQNRRERAAAALQESAVDQSSVL